MDLLMKKKQNVSYFKQLSHVGEVGLTLKIVFQCYLNKLRVQKFNSYFKILYFFFFSNKNASSVIILILFSFSFIL